MSELDKLAEYLKEHDYDCERIDAIYSEDLCMHQIVVYKDFKRSWDAICHTGSYGYEEGLLEIMGDIVTGDDAVEGYLTAQDIIDRLEK